MESERFDKVSRVLGEELSRRRALGVLGLLASALISFPLAPEIGAKPGKKDNGKDQGKGKGHHKGKDRDRKKRRATNQAEPCWRAGVCSPKKGANVSRCDLGGYTAPSNLDCTGCNISRANLRGAILRNANFTKANLSGSCLVDADLSGALVANTTNMANAVYCRTRMPDGSMNNSGCGQGTECCPVCDATHTCPAGQFCCSGRCVSGCCTNAECTNPALPICINNTCSPCTSSEQCGAGKACANGSCVPCLSPDPASTDGTQGLQTAIKDANSGATVRLCAGTWAVSSTVVIAKNLTLVGAGAEQSILDGGNATQVLRVVGGTGGVVTVKDLKVTRGSFAGYGGGITNVSGTLTLDTVHVQNNTASAGGGINNAAEGPLADLILKGKTIVSGNTASPYDGGGIYSQAGTVTVDPDTIVSGNTAARWGGGISIRYIAKLYLNAGSSVTGNTAGWPGGGVYNESGTSQVHIANTGIVTGNTPNNCAGSSIPATCVG